MASVVLIPRRAAQLGIPAAREEPRSDRPGQRLDSQPLPSHDQAPPGAGVSPDRVSSAIWLPADPKEETHSSSDSAAWLPGCASPIDRLHHPEGSPHVSAPAGFVARAPVASEGVLSAAGRLGRGAANCARGRTLCGGERKRWRDSGSFSWPTPRMRAGWPCFLRNAPSPGGQMPSC
jgi:hypothetical protein